MCRIRLVRVNSGEITKLVQFSATTNTLICSVLRFLSRTGDLHPRTAACVARAHVMWYTCVQRWRVRTDWGHFPGSQVCPIEFNFQRVGVSGSTPGRSLFSYLLFAFSRIVRYIDSLGHFGLFGSIRIHHFLYNYWSLVFPMRNVFATKLFNNRVIFNNWVVFSTYGLGCVFTPSWRAWY